MNSSKSPTTLKKSKKLKYSRFNMDKVNQSMQVPKGSFAKHQTFNLKNELNHLKRATDKDLERNYISNMARGTNMSST